MTRFQCRIGIHKKKKLGRFAEAKVCLICGRAWLDTEEFHKSQLLHIAGLQAKSPYQIFNEEEQQIIREAAAKQEANA